MCLENNRNRTGGKYMIFCLRNCSPPESNHPSSIAHVLKCQVHSHVMKNQQLLLLFANFLQPSHGGVFVAKRQITHTRRRDATFATYNLSLHSFASSPKNTLDTLA